MSKKIETMWRFALLQMMFDENYKICLQKGQLIPSNVLSFSNYTVSWEVWKSHDVFRRFSPDDGWNYQNALWRLFEEGSRYRQNALWRLFEENSWNYLMHCCSSDDVVSWEVLKMSWCFRTSLWREQSRSSDALLFFRRCCFVRGVEKSWCFRTSLWRGRLKPIECTVIFKECCFMRDVKKSRCLHTSLWREQLKSPDALWFFRRFHFTLLFE